MTAAARSRRRRAPAQPVQVDLEEAIAAAPPRAPENRTGLSTKAQNEIRSDLSTVEAKSEPDRQASKKNCVKTETRTGLSTVAPENRTGLSSVSVAALDRKRDRAGVGVNAMLRRAGVHIETWSLARKNGLRPSTLARLTGALEDLIVEKGQTSPSILETAHRAAVVMLAMLSGADPVAMSSQDFSKQRPTNREWLEASRLRRYGIYLLVVEAGAERVALARAIGCSRQNIHQAIGQVESESADPAIASLLGRVARLITGRGE